jgi:hypothetical protein
MQEKASFISFLLSYYFVKMKLKLPNIHSSCQTIVWGVLTMVALSAFLELIPLLTTALLPGWSKQGFVNTFLKSFQRR